MLTLYYSPGACSLAPHIVLHELGLEHERRPTLIAEGEHLSAEYLKINPRGRVPTLIAHGAVVIEVPAILAYLASLKPESGLLTSGCRRRSGSFAKHARHCEHWDLSRPAEPLLD